MDRLSIERLLLAYVDALGETKSLPEGQLRHYYREHFDIARNLLGRWQGGESEERLKSAVFLELVSYCRDQPPGTQAESAESAVTVSCAFGDVCRALGIVPTTWRRSDRSQADPWE